MIVFFIITFQHSLHLCYILADACKYIRQTDKQWEKRPIPINLLGLEMRPGSQ